MNVPQIVVSIWLIPKILDELVLTIFASAFTAFMDKIFGGSYCDSPRNTVLSWIFWDL